MMVVPYLTPAAMRKTTETVIYDRMGTDPFPKVDGERRYGGLVSQHRTNMETVT